MSRPRGGAALDAQADRRRRRGAGRRARRRAAAPASPRRGHAAHGAHAGARRRGDRRRAGRRSARARTCGSSTPRIATRGSAARVGRARRALADRRAGRALLGSRAGESSSITPPSWLGRGGAPGGLVARGLGRRDEPAAGSVEGGHGPASARASPARRSARPGIGSARRGRTRTWTRRPETLIVARLRAADDSACSAASLGLPRRLGGGRARRPPPPRRPPLRRRARRGSSAPPRRSPRPAAAGRRARPRPGRAASRARPQSARRGPRRQVGREPPDAAARVATRASRVRQVRTGATTRREMARRRGGDRPAHAPWGRKWDVAEARPRESAGRIAGMRTETRTSPSALARTIRCGSRPARRRARAAAVSVVPEGVGARGRAGRDAGLPDRLTGEQRLGGGRQHDDDSREQDDELDGRLAALAGGAARNRPVGTVKSRAPPSTGARRRRPHRGNGGGRRWVREAWPHLCGAA